MANLKSLAKDTVIYGLSSIVARFINFLLVIIQTPKFAASGGEYGIVTNIYAYTALLLVILTFGMETTFFRFMNKEGEDPRRIYPTSLLMVGGVSLVFALSVLSFLQPISTFMGYPSHPDYVGVMAVCVAFDAFQCIPFAYLRYQKRPLKFAFLKITNIAFNIILNLLYLVILPALKINPFGMYDEHFTLNVAYVFYINLLCTLLLQLCLWKELQGISWCFDLPLARRMLIYSWPILILGIAGILNQTVDKNIFPHVYRKADWQVQLGIYGATSKIAMIMAMITQAFRYAYEPFVFGNSRSRDDKTTYAKAMKYFVVFTLLAFLFVMGYINILRYMVARDYWEGLRCVPVVMVASILMGVYFNLSFWYKLVDKTIYGAYFSGVGCVVIIAINIIFVPVYGYMACAWAGVAGYGIATALSYVVGQKHFPIDYPLRDMFLYSLLTAVLYAAMSVGNERLPFVGAIALNTLLIGVFVVVLVKRDFPLSALPVIGKKFRKKA